ncbi:hypothetical protein I3J09_19405 [Streptomyces clavuligerus]|nr:hypothetical protein D1794_19970 [Streptomyces clavuligerus]MBY6304837.1 hypothetical protein [Streptomyces clavuligerus]QCS09398.1 hypothetical protein CRV15_19325 [Streptomyces clavuligerus]QPJ96647.1 hypothetical protein GE265_08760 [Streptomyces clavuligerus]QPL66678.1 hypothetical protein I3J04_19390 [Streptomyces clavuligerus]
MATTEPGRLRIIGAALAALVLAFGAATALDVTDRARAADDVVSRSQPLSARAGELYHSLAAADTAASSAFLAESDEEPPTVRKEYEDRIAHASTLLITAASHMGDSDAAAAQITRLNRELPLYRGRIETARTYNRQGLPLGGAYLRFANDQMTRMLLPAAERLYREEAARLGEDDREARFWPVVALTAGVLALGALGWAQWRLRHRTNRVVNPGLLASTAAAAALLLWLAGAHGMAVAGLGEAKEKGQDSLQVLTDARIHALKARAQENLALVARGATLTDEEGRDQYATEFDRGMSRFKERLSRAVELADDTAGRTPLKTAGTNAGAWEVRHGEVSRAEQAGDYKGALRKVIGGDDTSQGIFDRLDRALEEAIGHEQREFTRAAESGRDSLDPLPAGAALLAVLGAAGAVLGLNRRLAEYR